MYRPDFMTIYHHHRLSIDEIQGVDQVSRTAIACMLVKIPVPREVAEKVLTAVNHICRTNYTLATVDVMLVKVEHEGPLWGYVATRQFGYRSHSSY